MQVKEIKDDELHKHYEVTIPSNDIDAKIDDKLKEYGRSVHLKGFRPGKAPLNILRQHYGRRVMGEILEQAVNESSKQLMNEKGLKPAAQPKIEVVDFDQGKDLVYSIEVEQIPDFELKDVTSFKVDKPVADIRDDEVDEALERVAEHHKKYTAVKEKRAAKKGDAVKIDFEGELADGTKYPGMESSDFDLELGSEQFIPGFEDQLIGAKAGEEREVKVSFPEEYQVGELAGKDAIFKVKVKELQKAEKMEVGEELAQKVGFDSLDILKESIRNKLQSEYENMSHLKLKRNILDKLDDQYDFNLPEGLVEAEYNEIRKQVEHDHSHHDHDHDHDHSHELSQEDLDELKHIAKRRVKLGLVLAEIGREQDIEVSDNEIQQAIMKEAQKYPGSEQQVVEYYTKNQQALESIRAPLFEEKVIEHIIDLADVKEKVVTPEELAREDDSEDDQKRKEKKEKAAGSKAKSSGKSSSKTKSKNTKGKPTKSAKSPSPKTGSTKAAASGAPKEKKSSKAAKKA